MPLYPPLIPHPPLPVYSDAQLRVLKAIGEAAFHSVGDENDGQGANTKGEFELFEAKRDLENGKDGDVEEWQKVAVKPWLASSFSDTPNTLNTLIRYLSHTSPPNQKDLSFVLTLLSTSMGTAALTGWTSCLVNGKNFEMLDLKDREEALRNWSVSKVGLRMKIFKALAGGCIYALYNNDPLTHDAIGYPSPSRRKLYQPLKAPSHTFTFTPPPVMSATLEQPWPVMMTEVLVLGSGAGGGVVAEEISRMGWEVLVVDKGVYAPTGEKSRGPQEGFDELYESQGVLYSEDSSITVLAASVFGGGTTINWSASLRTQHYVREEWALKKGLTHFISPEFQHSLEAVTRRIGVSDKYIDHNKSNVKLLEGSKKMGAHIDTIPQNTDSKSHSCGFCSFGCPYGEKQGTPETWLVDAAKNGAKFMQKTVVEILLFGREEGDTDLSKISSADVDNYSYHASSRPRCVGALMQDGEGNRFIIKATKSVVLSAGSVNSPAVLLRSKIPNINIGKNLHLHPCSFITAHYDEVIKPWDGSIMTYLSNANENKDGSHYGPKLEVCMSWPGGYAGIHMPWLGNAEHRADALKYNHCLTLIALTRDRDSGNVVIDANGRPRVNYTLSKYDGESCLNGVINGAEILLSSGARRITTAQPGVPSYHVPVDSQGLADPRFKSWIEQVRKAGVWPGITALGSAHQMGSCAMSTSAATGVVDPRGRVWGTSGLYVADASVFPTPSGVNPMVTTSSVAYSIAQFIGQDLEAGGPTKAKL